MQHKYILIRQTEECAEWECPACERHVRLRFNGRGLEIVNRGDQWADHGSATTGPGLHLEGASVKAPDFAETTPTLH